MGAGKEILNQAKKMGEEKLKQMSKKFASMLLKNPYTYIVAAVMLVIIIVAGAFSSVAAEEYSNTEGLTEVLGVNGSGYEQFVKELHLWEGGGTIYKNSEDVDCYKVESDGSDTGSAVGYGVDIGTHGETLRKKGYDTSIGSLIPVEVVDQIEISELKRVLRKCS